MQNSRKQGDNAGMNNHASKNQTDGQAGSAVFGAARCRAGMFCRSWWRRGCLDEKNGQRYRVISISWPGIWNNWLDQIGLINATFLRNWMKKLDHPSGALLSSGDGASIRTALSSCRFSTAWQDGPDFPARRAYVPLASEKLR